MTNPSLSFTDGIGAATLVSQGRTFKNWTPDVHDIGDSQVPVGDNATFFFAYRKDFIVAFDIDQIPQADLDVVLRLKSWLVTGGSITINTEDVDAHVYTASLVPGTVPTIQMSDTVNREYTLHIEVINLSATPFTYLPVVTVADMTLTLLPDPLIFCPGDPPQEVTATLHNGDGSPVVGFTLNGVSNLEGSFTIDPFSHTTDSSGQVVFTVTPHLPGVGSVHAVAGDLIASVAVTVRDCGYHETYDQIDYPTWYAQYHDSSLANIDNGLIAVADVAANDLVHFSGGQMIYPGRSIFGLMFDEWSPIPFCPTPELWARSIVEVAGDTWDDTIYPDPSVGYVTRPLYFDVWSSVTGDGAGIAAVPISPVPQARDWYVYSNGTTSSSSGVDQHLTVGTHTFVWCVSNPTPTTLRIEMWIDAAPGDAPVATADSTIAAGVMLDMCDFGMEAPYSSGRSIAKSDDEILCGARTLNPFGVL